MISNNILILFGYFVLLGATAFCLIGAITMTRMGLAFAGRVGGDAWFFWVIFAIMAFACYWFFPFEVALKVVPVSVK